MVNPEIMKEILRFRQHVRVTPSKMWAFRAYNVVVRQVQRKILQKVLTFSVLKGENILYQQIRTQI